MLQIPSCLLSIQGSEVVANRDTLLQVAKLRLFQLGRQFLAPSQDNLNQLFFVGLYLGKEPNLLPTVGLEILRLIDYQPRLLVCIQVL